MASYHFLYGFDLSSSTLSVLIVLSSMNLISIQKVLRFFLSLIIEYKIMSTQKYIFVTLYLYRKWPVRLSVIISVDRKEVPGSNP